MYFVFITKLLGTQQFERIESFTEYNDMAKIYPFIEDYKGIKNYKDNKEYFYVMNYKWAKEQNKPYHNYHTDRLTYSARIRLKRCDELLIKHKINMLLQ